MNATIHGAVVRANQLKIEIIGLIKGFNCLFNPRIPHVHLNPLFQEIPELDPTKGGTLIGSSRDYVDSDKAEALGLVVSRLKKLGIEGLICIGGDGTLNGLQPLAERLPVVLAPKTVDNDLGLNYPSEPDEWVRANDTTEPAGNMVLSGAGDALRARLIKMIGDQCFQLYRRGNSAKEAIFTRKVGHTQRGGRPILFDRFYAAQLGAETVDLLAEGRNNAVSILQYTRDNGFHVEGYDANRFRDRWGLIHARKMHPALYDPVLMKPSEIGINYLKPIFTDAIGNDDAESMRQTLFSPGNLTQPYHSINTDIQKRIRY
ncbi:MAG: 6-phosphofructokinase, partial [Terrimicrobiaceae bacterium]